MKKAAPVLRLRSGFQRNYLISLPSIQPLRKPPKQHYCRGCNIPVSKGRWCTPACKHFVMSISVKYRYYRFAPSDLRAFILKRDNYKCVYCGIQVTDITANIDHVKPWPLGKTTPRNLVASCKVYNGAKRSGKTVKLKTRLGRRKLYGIIIGRNLIIPKHNP